MAPRSKARVKGEPKRRRCRQCGDLATHRLPALDRIGSRDGLCTFCATAWAKGKRREFEAELPYPITPDAGPGWDQPALPGFEQEAET